MLTRNMVHQNESLDEDLEHFEDIEEETDNKSSTASENSKCDGGWVCNSNIVNSNRYSSLNEDESPAYYSEDVLEEAEDLLVRDGSKKLQEFKTKSGFDGHKSKVSTLRSFLPGGYNPRHREPSFW